MKVIFLAITVVALMTILCSVSYANAAYDITGSGAAVANGNSPKIFQTVLKMSIQDTSTLSKGTFLVYGNDLFLHAYIVPKMWSFSYDSDGSFHGTGPVQTVQGQSFNMTLDGNRVYATNTGSLWRVSADMQGSNSDMILNYLVTGTDPSPTVNLSQNATIIIPNGNSAIANKAFYLPLNLEVMRGTTVTWENEDNIGHVIQSQDGHGNLVSLYNSGILHTGDTFSYKFVKPGTYYYFCTIHPWRTGVVTVS
ncbi:MAG TPA: plastocyanin/azurin family copper-binding protein [Candidatus Nitrosotalea sp.]|nr:plastocyanin/azurin family copper-binding protein [Candidatus Nitrosotalea sp.]